MKAAVLFGKHDVRITDFPEPPMGCNTVKIAVSYCGLCGTDLHKFNGKNGSRPVIPPVVLGHEISGIVEEVGPDVTNFKAGDRVVANPNWYCKTCDFCKSGLTHMCEHSRGVAKGFAEYVCPPEENVHKIPDSLSLKYAALTEPLACCLHGMDLLDLKLGHTVAVIGMGSIGSMMLQLCHMASAANIIVIEPDESKKEMAMKLGAALFVNPLKEDIIQVIKDAGIKNVDRVIECVGLKSTIESALNVAGKCATVVLFGLGDPENPAAFNQYTAFEKELVIKTSYTNPNTNDRAINLLASNAINVEELISKEMELDNLVEELNNPFYSKKGKVLVKINGEN